MNTSPRRSDIEARKTIVSFMAMKAIENILNKGQKAGDATKVATAAEIEMVDEITPRMEASVESHIMNPNNNTRTLPNGEVMNVNTNKEKIKMYLATIKEERTDSIDNDIEEEKE